MKRGYQYLIALLVVNCLIYFRLFSFAVFIYSDWYFTFKAELLDNIFPTTFTQSGTNILLWRYLYDLLLGLFGVLGYNSNVAEKFVIFWPIVFVTPLASFLLIRKVIRSDLAAVVGSLYFTFNSYFLSINTVGHELLSISFAYGTLALYTYIQLLETKKIYWAIITALLLFISGSYDLRSLYIVVGVVITYGAYHQFFVEKSWKKSFKSFILHNCTVFFSLLLLNVYWIFPLILSHSITDDAILSRVLFGGQFYNLQRSVTLFYPFWTGSNPTWFLVQPIPLYYWLYPILAFFGFVVSYKNKKIAFFGILALVGVFLAKQEGGPFPQIYPWLYNHIPGFSAFREASKFDYLIALGYAVLIAGSIEFLEKRYSSKKIIRYSLLVLISSFCTLNAIPYVTGSIQSLFVGRKIPQDYNRLTNYLTDKHEYSKILLVNSEKSLHFNTNRHPTVDILSALGGVWKGVIPYDFSPVVSNGKKVMTLLESEKGRRLVTDSSFGYVMLNINNIDTNSDQTLGESRSYFEKKFSEVDYLQKENIGLQNILLYRVKKFVPHIYLSPSKLDLSKDTTIQNITYTMVNPTEYKLTLRNISKSSYLNFNDRYHPEWKLYIGDYRWYKVLIGKAGLLPDKFHTANALNLNSFQIDPEFIKKHFSSDLYRINKDGSMDLQATIYFKPQTYLYSGFVISGLSLIVLVGIGVYSYKMRKRI